MSEKIKFDIVAAVKLSDREALLKTYRITWFERHADRRATTIIRAREKREALTDLFSRLGLNHRDHSLISYRITAIDSVQVNIFND